MRSCTLVLVALLALTAVGCQSSARTLEQVITTDPPSGVSVALHAQPTPSTQPIPGTTITIRIYLAQTGDLASSLSVFEISEAEGGYDLDGGVEGSAQGSGGTVVSSTEVTVAGFPGRDFEVDVTSNGVNGMVQSRIVYTGEHVIQVQAVGPDTRRDDVVRLFGQLTSTLDVGAEATDTGAPSSVAASPAPSQAGATPVATAGPS